MPSSYFLRGNPETPALWIEFAKCGAGSRGSRPSSFPQTCTGHASELPDCSLRVDGPCRSAFALSLSPVSRSLHFLHPPSVVVFLETPLSNLFCYPASLLRACGELHSGAITQRELHERNPTSFRLLSYTRTSLAPSLSLRTQAFPLPPPTCPLNPPSPTWRFLLLTSGA